MFSYFTIESRIFKEASYVLENTEVSEVHALGIWHSGLVIKEVHNTGLLIERYRSLLNKIKDLGMLNRSSFVSKFVALLSLIGFMTKIFRKSLEIRPKFLCVHNAELLPIACIYSKFVSCKIIYLPHELESKKQGKSKLYNSLISSIEKTFLKMCFKIIVVCEPIAEWYKNFYGLEEVLVLRNMPLKKHIRTFDRRQTIRKEKFRILDEDILYIYQGLIEESRAISTYLEAFKNSKNSLLLMGHAEGNQNIKNINQKHSNIFYKEPVPIDEITSFSSLADCGILVLKDNVSKSYQFMCPNKFFEYMHAGIPILVSRSLEYLARIVDTNNLGWVIDNQNLEDFIEKTGMEELKSKTKNIELYSRDKYWETDAECFKKIYV
tara:strand:+ start:16355 stop:17491 length:1137 start_codon:yes stop_codon:yes gene_type:complete